MSWEGYMQCLCKKGHYWSAGCEQWDEQPEDAKCSICKEKVVWHNIVDETNGSHYKGKRIDGYIKLKLFKQRVCNKCGCILEQIYKIPKKGYHVTKLSI